MLLTVLPMNLLVALSIMPGCTTLFILCAESQNLLDRQSLLPLEKLGITVPSETELEGCKSYLTDNLPMTDTESCHDCYILLNKLYEQKCAFPKVNKLAAALATFGFSVAICECSFSALSHIDTPHRQARSQDLEKGGYFERVRSVQMTLTRIFMDLE